MKKMTEKKRGYIYVMTTKSFPDMVKIGFATDVEVRRKQLSTTALPYPYEIFATYEVSGHMEDKELHKMIDQLNPDLRVNTKRELYVMSAEDAYKLLEAIAKISGTQKRLKVVKSSSSEEDEQYQKRPPINFAKCGIKEGSKLFFTEDKRIKVKVVGERKVLYGKEIRSLSSVAAEIKGCKAIQGTKFFTYEGRLLYDIAKEKQWE